MYVDGTFSIAAFRVMATTDFLNHTLSDKG